MGTVNTMATNFGSVTLMEGEVGWTDRRWGSNSMGQVCGSGWKTLMYGYSKDNGH